jgi:hypothetical protein
MTRAENYQAFAVIVVDVQIKRGDYGVQLLLSQLFIPHFHSLYKEHSRLGEVTALSSMFLLNLPLK